ncbi:hypothetical protein ACHRV6_22630 [Flavobacterium sp. FlaQc-51]
MELVLENQEFVELNIQETFEIEGGTWPGIGWWMDCGFSYGGQQELLWC